LTLGYNTGLPNSGRYIAPIDEFVMSMDNVLSSLHLDPAPPVSGHRYKRGILYIHMAFFCITVYTCVIIGTGAAISLAVSLLELLAPQSPGRVMVFTGGPCTVGPGQVVGLSFFIVGKFFCFAILSLS
jgi:protein transport protein SEC23